MATIRKRRNKWQVQVRRTGFTCVSKSFYKKADADSWARLLEAKADANELPQARKISTHLDLSSLIVRYQHEILPLKKGGGNERIVLDAILRRKISGTLLLAINMLASLQGQGSAKYWLF